MDTEYICMVTGVCKLYVCSVYTDNCIKAVWLRILNTSVWLQVFVNCMCVLFIQITV